MKESKSNGLEDIISQAIEEMKSEQGNYFSLEKINLAELERRTGISRAKLRRLKANNFNQKAHGLVGRSSRPLFSVDTQHIWTSCFAKVSPIRQCAWTDFVSLDSREASAPSSGTSRPTNTSCLPSDSWLHRRATGAVGSPPSREKPIKWTGVLLKFWTMTEQSTPLPALPWFATTAARDMLSSFPMQNRRTCSLV